MQKQFKRLIFISLCSIILYYLLINHSTESELQQDENCSRYPKESDILYDNIYWQVLEMPRGVVKIFNAYLDDRFSEKIIRVNVLSYEMYISLDVIYCQFWYNDSSEPFVMKANYYILMWPNGWESEPNDKKPYLISCPVYHLRIPQSVSLTNRMCDNATNNVKIINNQPANGRKKKFGLCGKYVKFIQRSYAMRLIEWVHLLRILGVERIHLYNQILHAESLDVMEHFEKMNYLTLYPFLKPSGISDDSTEHHTQDMLLQMVLLNDCFYRNRNLYELIAIFDTDEVIIPVKQNELTWADMMGRFSDNKIDYYVADNVYYPRLKNNRAPNNEIPSYMYMLQHIKGSKRHSKNPNKIYFKSILNTERVVVVHNHSPIVCIDGYFKCVSHNMSFNIAQLSHYRSKMETSSRIALKNDTKLWKYKSELIDRVNQTLLIMQIEP